MTIDVDAPLGRLVTENPARARVFRAVGLDYCCGGQRTLLDACEAAGLEVGAVVESLAATDGGFDRRPAWARFGITELVRHLVETHHAYLHAELARLSAMAERLVDRPGSPGDLHQVLALVRTLRGEVEPHLAKEEQVLFPWCRSLDARALTDGSLAGPVASLRAEHEAVGELLDELEAVTEGYRPPSGADAAVVAFYDGLATLDEDTRLHIHKENNLLLPMIVERLVGAGR